MNNIDDIQELVNMSNLSILDLSGNPIGDFEMKHIGRLHSLKELYLSTLTVDSEKNAIFSDGAYHLRSLTSLTKLVYCNSCLT